MPLYNVTDSYILTNGTDKTEIFTYNFNGFTSDYDAGKFQLSFFIPEKGWSTYGESYYLIVLGDDIADYTVQGYKNGACKATEKIKVTYEMNRYETTLGKVLETMTREQYDSLNDPTYRAEDDLINSEVTFEMYYGEVCRMMSQYKPISDYSAQRYTGPEIDGIISEPFGLSRVMFCTFSVTVPAGGGTEVMISQVQGGSYDYYNGSGGADAGIRGYDMVTTLGSRLDFSAQHAGITNYDNIEIVSQNFGFDLENGIASVELDVSEEHYYMNVRWKDD
ncbi:MAG: hypothetical protein LUI02_00480 [Clostridiales bacterium]|nr:hypothetical protein [Clostridiales bacterium]